MTHQSILHLVVNWEVFTINLSLCSSSNSTFLLLQYQLALQVTSPHVLFLLLHHQPGTPYLYIFALQRNSLPLSIN